MTDWTSYYSLMINRYRFLRAVDRWVPEVLMDLEQNVFPLFTALFCSNPSHILGESALSMPGGGFSWITWRATKTGLLTFPSWASEFECSDLESDRAAFKQAVEKWADSYHLNALWVKEEVFRTLMFWLGTRFPRTWQFRGPDPADDLPSLPGIQIDEQWSGDFWPIEKKRLLARIKDYGSEIEKHVKLMALRQGELRTKNWDHFRWAALYQCANLSPGKIVRLTDRKPAIHDTTVIKAIDSLFETIDLKKRPGNRGLGAKAKI